MNWEPLEPFGRLLQRKVIGPVSIGTLLAVVLLVLGVWLLVVSGGRVPFIIVGTFLAGIGIGYLLVAGRLRTF